MSLPKDHPYYKAPLEETPQEEEVFDLDRALEGLGESLDFGEDHRSGFINVVGRPNVGKSTLVNALVGERMNIVTSKPQTTRHRIFGILSGDDYQAVFSDTPGLIEEPGYAMQDRMNAAVQSAFEDADLLIFVVVGQETYDEDHPLIAQLKKIEHLVVVLNKADTLPGNGEAQVLAKAWEERLEARSSFVVSALNGTGIDELRSYIIGQLPAGPPYFPKDQLTDRPERFFVAEIIREQILEHYRQEIPYAVEVVIESFEDTHTTDGRPLVKIQAIIYTERESQKNILIGKGGADIKIIGQGARQRLEAFLERKVFLETKVKVNAGWRNDARQLKRFGYGG